MQRLISTARVSSNIFWNRSTQHVQRKLFHCSKISRSNIYLTINNPLQMNPITGQRMEPITELRMDPVTNLKMDPVTAGLLLMLFAANNNSGGSTYDPEPRGPSKYLNIYVETDIYCHKYSGENFVYHGPDIKRKKDFDHLEPEKIKQLVMSGEFNKIESLLNVKPVSVNKKICTIGFINALEYFLATKKLTASLTSLVYNFINHTFFGRYGHQCLFPFMKEYLCSSDDKLNNEIYGGYTHRYYINGDDGNIFEQHTFDKYSKLSDKGGYYVAFRKIIEFSDKFEDEMTKKIKIYAFRITKHEIPSFFRTVTYYQFDSVIFYV